MRKLRLLAFAAGMALAAAGAHALDPGEAVPNQASADSVASFTFTAPQKLLVGMTVKIGATSGYVMVISAASLPANGAVTACVVGAASPCVAWCSPRVVSDGTSGGFGVSWRHPLQLQTGVTVVFSTTGCDTLTASATAKFMGQAL